MAEKESSSDSFKSDTELSISDDDEDEYSDTITSGGKSSQ